MNTCRRRTRWSRQREDVNVSAADLLTPSAGDITEAGLRLNLKVGIQYLEAWLGGNGCVPLYNLMEDAATAEISRAQVWQWLHHKATLADGRPLTTRVYMVNCWKKKWMPSAARWAMRVSRAGISSGRCSSSTK